MAFARWDPIADLLAKTGADGLTPRPDLVLESE